VEQTFVVPDVSCGHCKSAIESALQPIDGVSRAAVDVDAKKVDVAFDESVVTRDQVVAAIEGAGYPVAG
jgi:copper chaperone